METTADLKLMTVMFVGGRAVGLRVVVVVVSVLLLEEDRRVSRHQEEALKSHQDAD